jgi:hypothetical protein
MKTKLIVAVVLGVSWSLPPTRADDELELARASAEFNVPRTWISMAAALERVALSSTSDTVVEALLGMKGGEPYYFVTTVSNDGFHTIEIDAQSGAFSVRDGIVGELSGNPGEADQLLGEFRMRAAATSAFELYDAVKAAPFVAQGAKPFAAYFNLQENELMVSVEVVHGAELERLDFNASTGAVVWVDEGPGIGNSER